MYEGRFRVTIQGRKTTFPRKERWHVQRAAFHFAGILFLERRNAFLRGKIAVYEWWLKGLSWHEDILPRTWNWMQEKREKNVKQNSEIIRMHFWYTFDASFSCFDALLMRFSKVHQKRINFASKVHQKNQKMHQKCIKVISECCFGTVFWCSFWWNSCGHKNGPRGYEK